MAALDKLPCEIMVEILSLLPTGDLACIALVSRQLHDLALPFLYRAPSLLSYGARTYRQGLDIFLWTILTPGRETLATHVRTLTFNWYIPRAGPTGLCPSEHTLIGPAALRFGLRRTTHGRAAKFVLLIHLLPNLQVLHISCPVQHSSFTNFMDARYAALGHPTTAPPVLQSLLEFHSAYDEMRRGITHKTLMVLLALPCIQRIQTCITPTESSYMDSVTGRAASSPLTHLRIWDPTASPFYLLSALSVPSALTHFSYSTTRYRYQFNLGVFWAAMRPLARTVVSLRLEVLLIGPEDGQVSRIQMSGATWSLVDWTALRTLSCSLVALMGERTAERVGGLARFLPRGVRELEVVGDPHWGYGAVVEEVVGLVTWKDALVPCLEKVAVRAQQRVVGARARAQPRADNGEARGKLRGACKAAGVTIVETISEDW